MVSWKNLDTLDAFNALKDCKEVDLAEVMSGENGTWRVKNYTMPMAAGLSFNYAAKKVSDDLLKAFDALAKEAQLLDKFKALYEGEVINTGEKRLVLHQLTRGQLGADVVVNGENKRDFYTGEQKKIADFANKVHSGKLQTKKARSSQQLFR